MEYKGHPHAKGHAKSCPECGFWLEGGEAAERPVPAEVGKSFLIGLLVAMIVGFFYGIQPGLFAGAAAFLVVANFIVPRPPDYYCFACKKSWNASELKE